MKQIYDWEKNRLNFVSPEGYSFDLKFNGNKTIVNGASASGKTMLCDKVRNIINDLNGFKVYGADNIFLVDLNNIDKIQKQTDKLVIIDRAGLILNDYIVKLINNDRRNRYLLFLRKPMGIEITPNHFAEMFFEENTLKLKYLFNVWGWC